LIVRELDIRAKVLIEHTSGVETGHWCSTLQSYHIYPVSYPQAKTNEHRLHIKTCYYKNYLRVACTYANTAEIDFWQMSHFS